jgi:replicative DNA helicase
MAEYINLEIERKVLRCLFWKKSLFVRNVSRNQLSSSVFSDKTFKMIFNLMVKHFQRTGERMSMELLDTKIDRLKLKGKDEKDMVDYRKKLRSVKDKFLKKKPLKKDLHNFDVYLEELLILMRARSMQRYTMDLFDALDNSKVEDAESLITGYKLPIFGDNVDQAEITENFQEREHHVLERKNNPSKYTLFKTGMSELDESLGGGIDREFCLVSGSSSAGKSTLLQSIAADARRRGQNVILFTIEMQLLETQYKIDCNLANIDYGFFRNPVEFYTKRFIRNGKIEFLL